MEELQSSAPGQNFSFTPLQRFFVRTCEENSPGWVGRYTGGLIFQYSSIC